MESIKWRFDILKNSVGYSFYFYFESMVAIHFGTVLSIIISFSQVYGLFCGCCESDHQLLLY